MGMDNQEQRLVEQRQRDAYTRLTHAVAAKDKEIHAYQVLVDNYAKEERMLEQLLAELEASKQQQAAASSQADAELTHLQEELAQASELLKRENMLFQLEYEKRSTYYRSFTQGADFPESRQLAQLLNERSYKGIVVYPAAVNWQPMQRPHHFLIELAKRGYLCFFCGSESGAFELEEVRPGLFVVNQEQYLLPVLQSRHVLVLNTWLMQNAWIDQLPHKTIWYDVLDRIDFFSMYDKGMLLKHYEVLSQAELVTYSANDLASFLSFRQDAMLLPNAVRPEDFQLSAQQVGAVPDDLQPIIAQGKKVLGYFGAIEQWFDRQMVQELAQQDVEIVLIGHCGIDRDGFAENVHLLGRKRYEELVQYAACFDALLIPFKLNELTHAVSPVKFFEYCALGKPVLTTAIREMVPFVGPGVYLYADKQKPNLRRLFSRPPASYQERLKQIAFDNTWQARIDRVEERLQQSLACAPLYANKTHEHSVGVFTATFFDYEGGNFYSGGAERYLIDLHEICRELGYKMEIYQYGNSPWYRRYHDIEIHSLGNESLHMNQPFTTEVLTRYNNSYLHAAYGNFDLNVYSAFFQAYPGIAQPSIGISHGVAWDNEFSKFQNGTHFWQTNLRFIESARQVDKLISVDTNTTNWFQTVAYDVAERSVVIPNYVNHEEFRPVERDSETIRVVYPRRLYKARGLYLTLDVVDEILAKYANVEFHFVGKGFADDVKQIEAKRQQWPDRVFRYHRDPERMHEVYRDADIVLIPTLYSEGTSLSCLEACASGNAVIATRVGGLTDIIFNEYNGLLISPNRDDLLEAICRLIENESLRKTLGRNAIEVSKAFAKKQWKARWKKELQKMIGSETGHARSLRKSVEVKVRGREELERWAERINRLLSEGYDVFIRPQEELDVQASFCRFQLLHPDETLDFVPDEVVDWRGSESPCWI